MNFRNYTPDSWIERRDEDIYPPRTDADMCEEGICDHHHCEGCNAIMSPDYVALYGGAEAYVGMCDICWWAWMSTRQLTYPPYRERLISLAAEASEQFGDDECERFAKELKIKGEWVARAHDLDKHRRASAGERPCPICGVTIHAQLKCGDGRIVDYCAPTNTRMQELREARAYVRLDDAQTQRRVGLRQGAITDY